MKNLFAILIFCFLGSGAFSQDASLVIATIDKELKSNKKTISEILTDTAFMYLHSLTAFREVIKKNATAAEISIAAATEPGVSIKVNGTVLDRSGRPISNILIYFYHTSDKGWYADTAVHILSYEGDHRHSRLFGYTKTDSKGKFIIRTIRPNGYPGSDLAAHIHIQMWNEDGSFLPGIPGELQFKDDIRMTEERRRRSISQGFLVASNDGTKEKPIYNYAIKSTAE